VYTDPSCIIIQYNYLDSDIPIQSYAQVYPLLPLPESLPQELLIFAMLT
jgi:putative transport protein